MEEEDEEDEFEQLAHEARIKHRVDRLGFIYVLEVPPILAEDLETLQVQGLAPIVVPLAPQPVQPHLMPSLSTPSVGRAMSHQGCLADPPCKLLSLVEGWWMSLVKFGQQDDFKVWIAYITRTWSARCWSSRTYVRARMFLRSWKK